MPPFPARGRWIAGAMSVAAMLCTAVVAGPAQPPAPDPARELLARSITRLALLDLRGTAAPGPADYRAASLLLTMAHELAPGDPEMVRRAIEAAYAADDRAMVLELTRTLLRLDPADTIAQLRLLTASITTRAQNADDRLRAYEACLSGPDSAHFDAAIKSRLALDAALLLRERGDEKGFVARLTQAVQLDSTHKEAAALAATYYAERVPQDRVGGMEWLVVLLKADPVDPNVHMTIARELASAGAYAQAKRFHTNALRISYLTGGAVDEMLLQGRVLQWYIEGPGAVVREINLELSVERDAAARQIRQRVEAKLPTDDITKPEEIRLSLPIASVAILTAQAAGEHASATAAMQEVTKTLNDTIPKIQEAVRQGRLNEAQGQAQLVELTLHLYSLRLWAGLQVDEVKADLEQAMRQMERMPEGFAPLTGWLKVRTGDARGALADLEPIADASPMARLGVGAAFEQLGEKDRAIAEYRRVLRDYPLLLVGAWARARLLALGGGEEIEPARAALERIAAGVPGYVDRMIAAPREFLQLRTEVANAAPEAIDRVAVRVTIENLSDIPLALGADRPLSTRLLLAPRLDAGLAGSPLNRPEIVDVNQRLRLMPRERLTATIWPDPGQGGWLMEAMANRTIRVRWRVIQGFRIDRAGGFQPGPMGVASETEAVVRRPLPEASLSPAALAAKVAGDPVEMLPRLAFVTRAFLLAPALEEIGPRRPEPLKGELGDAPPPPQPPPAPDEFKVVADAFAARYASLPPVQRAILVATLPHARLAPVMAGFDQVVRGDADPLVQALVLVTRVSNAEDELLTRAAQSPDERVRALAGHLRARLAGSAPLYSRLSAADIRAIPAREGREGPAPQQVPPAAPDAGRARPGAPAPAAGNSGALPAPAGTGR
ncbi:MAG: hypothetical protein WD749_08960 [Phycisphaerales bacterium]